MTLTTTTGNETTFLYRFLISPRFRAVRHGLLIAVLLVISFNIVFTPYEYLIAELGYRMYLFVFCMLLVYSSVAYFNLYYLLPRYLLTKRYTSYVVFLSISVIGALLAQMFQEYIIFSRWIQVRTGQQSFFSMIMLIDYISAFMLTVLCMAGGSMTILLRLWMMNSRRIAQLEKTHILSKVEQLKEQVSPSLLFKTLNRSGHTVLTDPAGASRMLMKLSQLLRYQLYDCKREKVLLSSEITFLTNYLILEKSDSMQFDYTLSSAGEVDCALVPPLLFIPFVQYAVEKIYSRDTSFVFMNIRLEANAGNVLFTCSCPGMEHFSGERLERIRHRLNLQYGVHYKLTFTKGSICLELKGGEL